MSINLTRKSLDELRRIVVNHRAGDQTHLPLCRDASDELERRKGGPLSFWTTLAAIRHAAERRQMITPQEIVKANGSTWSQARQRIVPHLNEVLDYAIDRGWPLVTAVVADAPQGGMSDETLKGFARSAELREKFPGGDEAEFLKAEQEEVFAWADRERGRDLRA